VRLEVSNTVRATDSTVRSVLRGFGRAALWTALGLLLLRGVLVAPSDTAPVAHREAEGVDPASAAFAVRFARTYLSDPSAAALSPFLAEGVRVSGGTSPHGEARAVAQAEVSDSEELGGGRSVLTVAAELRDARVLYLAVPIVRDKAGEVAALGAPYPVAAPGRAGAETERPQPLAGTEAAAIAELAEKFLPEYVSARESASLSYLLAPGAAVVPLGGAVVLDGITGVTQLGSGEGPSRTVLVAARLSDPQSGATYPVGYRLDVIESGGRWYVARIEGASS
jgi:hypothetical protein